MESKLTGKQKRYLRSLGNGIDHRYLLGKGDIDDSFLDVLDKALEAKELIKVGLLQSSELTPEDAAERICRKLHCELAQIIGRVLLLYRPSEHHKTIELPR